MVTADRVFTWVLGRLLNLIPDVNRFDLHMYVANGFDVSLTNVLLIDNLIPLVTRVGRYGCDFVNFGAVFRSMTGFGGTGEGPGGPAMEFRLQAIPPTVSQVTGTSEQSNLVIRDGYPAPCKYLASPYPAAAPRIRSAGATGRRCTRGRMRT